VFYNKTQNLKNWLKGRSRAFPFAGKVFVNGIRTNAGLFYESVMSPSLPFQFLLDCFADHRLPQSMLVSSGFQYCRIARANNPELGGISKHDSHGLMTVIGSLKRQSFALENINRITKPVSILDRNAAIDFVGCFHTHILSY